MKKIIELSKKILLFALIIVFPINSFAAVSVSDGSAFVSKSEFSSTINNISNRMAIMENTLDAKIDSLVSSYLSRNGIWNGDKQTLKNTTIGWAGVKKAADDVGYYRYFNYTNTNSFDMSGGAHASYLRLIKDGSVSNKEIITSVSKTGLMLFKYNRYFTSSTTGYSSSGWAVSAGNNTNNNIIGDQVGLVLSVVLQLTINGAVVFSDPQQLIITPPAALSPQQIDNISSYFFVSKGNKILANVVNSSNPRNVVCLGGERIGYFFSVREAIVY